ncbi:EI24 domain-containing protein [Cognatishimia sp.]|uniref:EI24 domain-containing protein n=1 Tax=Cognatishimia sp. TaxID=2211648 RepID=UPI003512D8E9
MALGLIFSSFFSALGQIGDARFRGVLFMGLGLTLTLLVASYFGLLAILNTLGLYDLAASALGEGGWGATLINATSLFAILLLSVFLMVPVASAFTSLFLDRIAGAVEDRHYRYLPDAESVPFGDALKDTVNFLGILVAANVLALLLYLALPPFAPLIFWGLNGFLLGREYFFVAAMRRIGRAGAKEMRREHFATIWVAGTLMAIPLSVPLVNLLIPILGAATFTHIFHKLEGTIER